MQCAWQSVLRVDLNQHDTPRALRLVQFSILHFLSWEKPSLNLSASSGISQQIHSDCTVLVRSQTAASGPHFCSSWNKLPAAERLSAVLRVVALWKIDARSWLAKTLCSSLAPQPGPAPRILDWPGTCVRPKAATEHRAYAEMRELQTS